MDMRKYRKRFTAFPRQAGIIYHARALRVLILAVRACRLADFKHKFVTH